MGEWHAGTASDTSYLMVRANQCNDLVKEIYRSIDTAKNRMKGMGDNVDYALREEVHNLNQLLTRLYADKKQVGGSDKRTLQDFWILPKLPLSL